MVNMCRVRTHLSHRCGVLLLAVSAAVFAAQSAAPELVGAKALLAKYAAIQTRLENNAFEAPIYVESVEQKGFLRMDVYGTLEYSFDVVARALQTPANWCAITPMHIN